MNPSTVPMGTLQTGSWGGFLEVGTTEIIHLQSSYHAGQDEWPQGHEVGSPLPATALETWFLKWY